MLKLNKIHHGDCLELMKDIPDKSIDLIIADPPYGMNYQSNFKKNKFNKITNDNVILIDWLFDAFRVLKDGGALYCYTRWDVFHEWYEHISELFKVKNTIIWFKRGGGLGDLKGAYMFNHEFIIYAVKGRHILNGKRLNDVWEIPKDNVNSYQHPTQKPLELSKRIIEKSSNENEIVLIPFAGSGSECVSATKLKRFFYWH
jgi:DNA modification methylase